MKDGGLRMLYPKFKKFVAEHGLISEGDRLLLAVSGGVDSMVMADLVARLARPMGLAAAVAHVNHGLRGKDSHADEELVRHAAEEHGFQFLFRRARPSGRGNLQDTARGIRIEFFRRAASEFGAKGVLLAHNRGDQAETVLMHMVRGAGLEGLVGMRPLMETGGLRLMRPMLFAARDEIAGYAAERGIAYREDATNLTGKYRRNEIRLRLMPLLREFNPRIEEGLSKMAARLADEDEALALIAAASFHEALADVTAGRVVLRAGAFCAMPRSLRARVLRIAWERASGRKADLNSDQVRRIDMLATSAKASGLYRLPSSFVFTKRAGLLEIKRSERSR